MSFLDRDRLDALDAADFRGADPFPWVNPHGLLTDAGWRRLVATLPDVALFERVFGKRRAHGQASHDRFVLEYDPALPVADEWHAFARELQGDAYRKFLKRMLGRGLFRVRFHWHYTPTGCSVSPHCDAHDKLGSHIFYFNTADDWDPAWGGETLILDDGGRFNRGSAPGFGDFDRVIPAEAGENASLLFARTGRSWHGVREIACPEGRLRKVFIVVIENPVLGLGRRVKTALRGAGARAREAAT